MRQCVQRRGNIDSVNSKTDSLLFVQQIYFPIIDREHIGNEYFSRTLSRYILQVKIQSPFQQGNQLIQVGGGNFNSMQPLQTVTIDGQEALFIPNTVPQQHHPQALQLISGQTLITPNGQLIRGPGSVVPTQYNTIQFPMANGRLKT